MQHILVKYSSIYKIGKRFVFPNSYNITMSEMNTKICLKDAQGRVLQMQNLHAGNQHEFDVEKLKDGVYFVELQLPKGRAITHQFHINH
jgi:Secretion system C-terminal sorting domain